jgi:two-component system response regulator AtoC
MRTKASVLIAEDESQARESLRALLEDEGYQVLCAPDGMEASRILSQSTVDAALIDIRMPFKDGLALLRELKDHPAPPTVLIMTAYGSSAAAIEAMALGAFDYLTKPLNFDELRIQLQRAIEDRRRTSELEAYRIEEDAQQESDIVGSSPAMQKLYKLNGERSHCPCNPQAQPARFKTAGQSQLRIHSRDSPGSGIVRTRARSVYRGFATQNRQV